MHIWPPTRESIKPIAIGLSVLAAYALLRQWFVPAGVLAVAAAVFWIAPHDEKLMLFLTTPNAIAKTLATTVWSAERNARRCLKHGSASNVIKSV